MIAHHQGRIAAFNGATVLNRGVTRLAEAIAQNWGLQWSHGSKPWCNPNLVPGWDIVKALQWSHGFSPWCNLQQKRTAFPMSGFNGATNSLRGVTVYFLSSEDTWVFWWFPRTYTLADRLSVQNTDASEKYSASQAVAVPRTSLGFNGHFTFAQYSVVKERCFDSACRPELSKPVMAAIAKGDRAWYRFGKCEMEPISSPGTRSMAVLSHFHEPIPINIFTSTFCERHPFNAFRLGQFAMGQFLSELVFRAIHPRPVRLHF
jgi:hypothetical protein